MYRLLSLTALLSVLAASGSLADLDTFMAVVGMDDEAEYFPASSAFQVYLDDELVLETDVLRPGDDPVPIELPLGDAESLRLVITDGGDTVRNDRGDWADARLVDSATGETVFLSDRPWTTKGEWIRARLDRTVTGNPLTLQGEVYCRGLGGFALMDYEWSGWGAWLDEIRAQAEADASAGLADIGGELTLSVPRGVTVWIDGNELHDGRSAADVAVGGATVLTLGVLGYTAPSLKRSVLADAVLSCPAGEVPLTALAPDRIENPAAGMGPGGAPVLSGQPYWAGQGVGRDARFQFRAPAATVAEVLAEGPADPPLRLTATAGVAPTDGFAGSLEVVVTEDDVVRYRSGLVSAADAPLDLDVPLQGRGEVRVELRSLGDGNLADAGVLGDAAFRGGESNLRLDDIEPWMASSGWGEVGLGHGADGRCLAVGEPGTRFASGVGIAAEGFIEWRDPLKMAEARDRALELVGEAEALHPESIDDRVAREQALAGKRRLLREATVLDPRCAAGQLALAEFELGRRFMRRAMDAARRVVDRGGADAAQVERATEILDECYAHLYTSPSYPASDRRLGPDEIPGVTRVVCEPPEPGEPPIARGQASLDLRDGTQRVVAMSRGLEVSLSVRDGDGSEFARTGPAVDPWVALDAGSGEVTVAVAHDFARDRFGEELEVWIAASPGPAPILEWRYELVGDGSVQAELRVPSTCVASVPSTVERCDVEGGAAVMATPAATYGSELAGYTSTQPCLVVPSSDGPATLSFTWPDGACTLPPPMGHFTGGGDRLWVHTVRQENDQASALSVRIVPPAGAGDVVEAEPPEYETSDDGLTWELGPRGFVRYVVEYPAASTAYLHRQVENMTIHIPATGTFADYLPEFVDDMRLLYDRLEQLVGGYASEHEVYVLVPAPRQLPGYGGATWGGDEVAESWVPASGHIGEYPLRYRWNSMGIHSHELHWMFLAGVPIELPQWLREGLSMYTEIEGDEAMGQIGWDDWPRRNYFASRATEYFEEYTEPSTGYAWWTDEAKSALPSEEAENARAALVQVCEDLEARYGPDFWGDFCRAARETRESFADTEDNIEKTRMAIELMIDASGDPDLRQYFAERGWPVE